MSGQEFKWTAEVFGTNNAHMDEEHQGLFTAIDALDVARSAESFEALAGLVITHFADEEKEMTLPEEHLKIHKDFLEVATAKLGELKAGTATVDDGLMTFVKDWLMNHIISGDRPTYGQ
jgi:hemerythrin